MTQQNVQDNNSNIVQVKNPKSGCYIKIDKSVGKIISYKKSKGAYKGILIVGNRKNED